MTSDASPHDGAKSTVSNGAAPLDPRAPRFAVFSGQLTASVRRGVLRLHRDWPHATWLIVVARPTRTAANVIRSQGRQLRRNGWRWIPHQSADAGRRLMAHLRTQPRPTAWERDWADFVGRPAVTLLEVEDLAAATTVERVEKFAPDVGISLAAPILKRSLFGVPRLGTFNLHKGKLPDYRGMPPAFWELWNNEPEVGCSVHRVDDRLDTGPLVRQDIVARAPHSTLRGLQLQLDEIGIALTAEAVRDVVCGACSPLPQPSGGRTYRKPTLAQSAALRRKLESHPPTGDSTWRRWARDSVAATAWRFSRVGLTRVLRPRITVLLYHRVTDDVRDNLSVGIEQFDRQMSLLRQHCEVLPLAAILAARAIPPSRRPQVGVTFDDGYLDNYAHAAPILRRHGIPAAFFVSTGLIGSDGRFPHDRRRGNPQIPLMTWDQVRELHRDGFTIGSHSVSHIDCAREPEATVVAELSESLDRLRTELGASDIVFAYPYGGRQHMTPERLERVKEAGYAGCLSAYGGSNISRVDPWNVLRRGIHWAFSDRAFLLECLGLR